MRTHCIILGVTVLLSGPCLPLAAHAATPQQPDSALGGAASPAVDMALIQPTLTLQQAISLSLSSNPALRAAGVGIAIADGARQQAALIPNPELSVLREGAAQGNRTQTVQISQPLELGGKRAARIAVAELDRALAADEVRVKAAELRAEVTAAYFDALAAQERVELAEGALTLALKTSHAANRRVIAGKVSPVEESRAHVAAASVRLELTQANADLAGARRRLAAMWGSPYALQQRLAQPEPDASTLPPLEMLEAQLESAPQLRQARTRHEREQAQAGLERAQRMPDLTLTLGAKKEDGQGRSQAVFGVAIPLPLFQRNQGNVVAAQRRAEQAALQRDVVRLETGQALADAYLRAEVAQQQIDTIRADMLPAARSALDAAMTGFELGKFNFLDVLDAQRTLSQTRAHYLAALSGRYRAIADLQRYVDLK
ncbi:MAG: TolC family protein [Burkholderiaceae bacterium]|nr:TolC family protein [Burkholderiaceae bacterium]